MYVRLVFGCRSSARLFDTLSQALCWIACHNYGVLTIFHLLDDFLTVDEPDSATGYRTMAVLSLLFNRLHVPLATHKCVWPTVCLEYLGVVLDSSKMEARLPLDKVSRIIEFIETLLNASSCSKRQLLQLLGHFNFASRVILPGRSFVSYLIDLSTSVKELWHHVYLDIHCREDLHMWHEFLRNWNGVSLFYDAEYTFDSDMELQTDSSLIGFGGIFGSKWFCSEWPELLPAVPDGDLSMAFRELYPIVAAAILWGKLWTGKRVMFTTDNQATMFIVRKGRSRCLPIMKLMRTLTWTAVVNNFYFSSRFIPTQSNGIADSLSRLSLQKFRLLAPHADPIPLTCPAPEEILWRSKD